MIALAGVVGATTLAVGLVAVLLLRRLPSLRLQLVGLSVLSVLLPLGAVLLSGVAMFDSGHDLTILSVAAASATVALAAAALLGRSMLEATERVRSAAEVLAEGDLAARAPLDGPTELAQVAASLNEMASRLEELFDARRQLVAWASHDLRTPLANMQAMLEAIEDGLVEPERYLGPLRQQVRTLTTLVDDLFELARIDAGTLTLELREAPLAGLVHSCLRGLEAEAASRGVELTSHIDEMDTTVRCAPELVERVLFNLLTNALRHTPADGTIAVVVQPVADDVRIMVEDTGVGLSADSLPRVSDQARLGVQRRLAGRVGTGLGLAISRGLVEAQGGRIWAENRPEGGARVSFTLPRVA